MKKQDVETPPPTVVCGDFNEDEEGAAGLLLKQGEVPAGCRIRGAEVTSKAKKQVLGPFQDAHGIAYAARKESRPPTIICPNLDSAMITVEDGEGAGAGDSSSKLVPTDSLLKALKNAFDALGGGKAELEEEVKLPEDVRGLTSSQDVEKWLVTINGQMGRGSEYRNAMACMEEKGKRTLNFEEFTSIYMKELKDGKFWGVDHDLRQALGYPVEGAGGKEAFQVTSILLLLHLADAKTRQAVYDFIYFSQVRCSAASVGVDVDVAELGARRRVRGDGRGGLESCGVRGRPTSQREVPVGPRDAVSSIEAEGNELKTLTSMNW
eukprot:752195-Hanusia_phi.AAC.2